MPHIKKKSRKINVYLNRETSYSIYGFNENQVNQLKQIALEKYGEANISLLVRELVRQELAQPQNSPVAAYAPNNPNIQSRKRVVIRFPPADRAYLIQRATLHNQSLNGTLTDIIAEYIKKNPVLNNDAVEAVYKSTVQLRALGSHLNQIARKLNAGESVSLSTEFIIEIKQFIIKHAEIVNKMIQEHRQRIF